MWTFGTTEDVEIQIPRIVEVLSTDGYAWAAERASLQGIIEYIETYPMKIPPAYETWLQIAYCMKGRFAEAHALVSAERVHLVEVKYPVPDMFKLCDRFLARIDAASAGQPGLFPPDPDLT